MALPVSQPVSHCLPAIASAETLADVVATLVRGTVDLHPVLQPPILLK